MGTLAERDALIGQIFDQHDVSLCGELTAHQLQLIHMDMRIGGISIPQVTLINQYSLEYLLFNINFQIEESIKYVCVNKTCEKSELFDVLQEMDRRYFLIQDLRWEFSMLDITRCNAIPPAQAKYDLSTLKLSLCIIMFFYFSCKVVGSGSARRFLQSFAMVKVSGKSHRTRKLCNI